MKKNTIGIFANREDAEMFINHIRNKLSIGADDISYVYKNIDGEQIEVKASEVGTNNMGDGAATGAKTGAVVGALAGLATVAGIIPVIGPIFIAGPLLAAIGITGAAGATAAGAVAGAAVGGLVGALLDLGVSEDRARVYQDRVLAGDILVAVRSDENVDVEGVMIEDGAMEVETHRLRI